MRKWTRFGGGLGAAAVARPGDDSRASRRGLGCYGLRRHEQRCSESDGQPDRPVYPVRRGGYGASAVFPDRGGWRTDYVANGTCVAYDMGGSIWEEVDVYDSDTGQYIGDTIYDGVNGETVVTTPGPSFNVIIG